MQKVEEFIKKADELTLKKLLKFILEEVKLKEQTHTVTVRFLGKVVDSFEI
jgi:hypothetical protein